MCNSIQDGLSATDVLPQEMWFQALYHLSIDDFPAVEKVCWCFYRILRDPQFRRSYFQDFSPAKACSDKSWAIRVTAKFGEYIKYLHLEWPYETAESLIWDIKALPERLSYVTYLNLKKADSFFLSPLHLKEIVQQFPNLTHLEMPSVRLDEAMLAQWQGEAGIGQNLKALRCKNVVAQSASGNLLKTLEALFAQFTELCGRHGGDYRQMWKEIGENPEIWGNLKTIGRARLFEWCLSKGDVKLWDISLMENFEKFSVSTSFDDESLVELCHAVYLKRIQELKLSYTNVTKEGIRGLSASANFTNLRILHLKCVGFRDEAVAYLANSQHVRSLTVLDLSINQLGDSAILSMARSSHFRALEVLDLSENERLTDQAVEAIENSYNLMHLQSLGCFGCPKITHNAKRRLQENRKISLICYVKP